MRIYIIFNINSHKRETITQIAQLAFIQYIERQKKRNIYFFDAYLKV